jgi:heme/copper-type cytochrome/quinol oxidase subunit 3
MSIPAVASFALGIVFMLGLGLFRVANPIVTQNVGRSTGVIDALGAFGLFTIVLVAIVVVLGHLGLAATRSGGRRGRAIAAAGTTLGYVLVFVYVTTFISAAIATSFPDNGTFVQNFFYWV